MPRCSKSLVRWPRRSSNELSTMMRRTSLALSVAGLVVLMIAVGASTQADTKPTVGILPFDVVSVAGATRQAGEGLARLVRIEMVRAKEVSPMLLERKAETKKPVDPQEAARIGTAAGADFVLIGAVLEAATSQSSKGANSGRLMSRLGVRGRVSKTKAEVTLHAELVDSRSGEIVHEFEVKGSESDVGVGADVWTVIGGVDLEDDAWLKAPMAKALREAAQKVAREVGGQTKKRKARP